MYQQDKSLNERRCDLCLQPGKGFLGCCSDSAVRDSEMLYNSGLMVCHPYFCSTQSARLEWDRNSASISTSSVILLSRWKSAEVWETSGEPKIYWNSAPRWWSLFCLNLPIHTSHDLVPPLRWHSLFWIARTRVASSGEASSRLKHALLFAEVRFWQANIVSQPGARRARSPG